MSLPVNFGFATFVVISCACIFMCYHALRNFWLDCSGFSVLVV